MKSLRIILLAFTLLPIMGYAQPPSSDKVDRVRAIWSPIFESVMREAVPPDINEDRLLRANEVFYSAYSEFLSDEYISTHEAMFKTTVGNEVGRNMVRALFGLQSFELTYNNFSNAEQAEWEEFARNHYSEIKDLNLKMSGFNEFLVAWIASHTSK